MKNIHQTWLQNPVKLLAALILIIALTEGGIMYLLSWIPATLPEFIQSSIDVLLLVFIVGPVLYFFIFVPMLREIAERRAAESALLASELNYQFLNDNLLDVIYELDADLVFTFLTPSIQKLIGYSSTEAIGTSLFHYLNDSSQKNVRSMIERASEEYTLSLQPTVYLADQLEMVCRDGTHKWVEIRTTFVFAAGKVIGIVGVARDIDTRKKAEVEKDRAYALLDKTISSLNEAVIIMTSKGRSITRVNTTAELMFGYSAEELIGSNMSQLHLDKIMNELFSEMIDLAHAKEKTEEATIQMKRKDGSTFFSELLITPITVYSDSEVQLVCVVRDITERIRNEDQLSALVQEVNARNKFVESILVNLQSGIIVIDLKFRVRMVNSYVTGICRQTQAQILEKPLVEICPELHESISALRSDDELTATFFGHQVVIGYILSDLTDSEGTIVGNIISFKDLTEIIKIRKALRQKERLSAMGELVARVAHEMRNPLFGMTAAAQILEMELSLNASQQELMNSLLKESRRLNNLVEELLQTTRETRILRKKINLVDTLNESLQIITPLFEEKGVSLHKSFSCETVQISADYEKLEQVIINLVKNALEASRTGGYVSVKVTTDNEWASVIVLDKGEGIPLEKIENIFDVFYTTKKNGTGLGLSISRNIINAHGGMLTAKNNQNGGAEFIIRLPLMEGHS